jgi:hypothetical protein
MGHDSGCCRLKSPLVAEKALCFKTVIVELGEAKCPITG